jgi:FecR protein
LALMLAATIGPACAATSPTGQAVAVNQNAAAAGSAGSRPLLTNGDIFTGDRITTDAKGEAQLHFTDDTRMIVGPNSDIAIDKFVVSGPANAQKVTINAAKGAFRFITGTAPKQAYEIDTPVATINVRGTMFDFAYGSFGAAVYLYRDTNTGGPSSVIYCDKAKPQPHCTQISDECSLVILPINGSFQWVDNFYDRTRMAHNLFPFLDKRNILPDFRVLSDVCDHFDNGSPDNKYDVFPGDDNLPTSDIPDPPQRVIPND